MKLSYGQRQQGNTLILTLIMALTIGTVLASYLGLIGSRYKVTSRSQCWNAAMPVLEAGIEEALTHLQDDLGSPGANSWTSGTLNGQPVYTKQRTFSDGSYYLVNIYYGTPSTNVYSTGFVPIMAGSSSYVSRTVKVMGSPAPLINVAFAAVDGITMNGSGLASNSFNSSDPTLSTNGQYDPTKTSTNGNVASVYGPVNLGNHNIAGNLYLGASASTTVSPGQVSGQIYTDFNVSFPDVVLPATSWIPATTSTVGGSTVYNFTTSGDYSVSASNDILVQPGVTVRLRVDTTSFNPGNIHIFSSTNGTSGTLTVYQVSGSATLSGNITVDSGRAENFWYYGLPGVTSITYSGNSTFIGVIYAPEADLTLNGGGNNNNVVGAAITKSITMNGHYDFHFDEDLLSVGPIKPYVVTSWAEL